jgi:hypothetical protein
MSRREDNKMTIRVIGRKEDSRKKVNTHYMLSDGRVYTREEIIEMWKHRLLPGYHVCRRNNREDLCNSPHTSEDDKIDKQPLV